MGGAGVCAAGVSAGAAGVSAAGCLLLICLQAIINLGVVTGMLPTKGMSMPFISAGGSNLLLMGLLVGIIINTQRAWERPKPLVRKRALTEVIG